MWVDATIKVEEGMEVDNSRSPVKTSILPLPTFTPETSEEGLPRTLLEPSSVSQDLPDGDELEPGLLSPTTTEPIEELMLPRQRRLPSPPVELRADRYREIKDQLVQARDFEDEESDDEQGGIGQPIVFEPHIVAMVRERIFYPFIEINRPGPKTDTSIPILH